MAAGRRAAVSLGAIHSRFRRTLRPMKFVLPIALLLGATTLVVAGGFSMTTPDANLPWTPSNARNYGTVGLLLVGITLGVLGVGVWSTRLRPY